MQYSTLFSCLLPLLSLSTASPLEIRQSSWPNGPLSTNGRWILDAAGNNISFAGVNWPGAADTMIPEGLQYSSISDIVAKIKDMGMNIVRLTYAIEMIDDFYANGEKDTSILDSFQSALGTDNGTLIFNDVIKNNPSFTKDTTRMEVFDAIAKELAAQQIYVHLDNHISKAKWCCSSTDGNGWFGDTEFDVANWIRGLEYMAVRGASWTGLISMSLRNELRSPDDNATLAADSYNWANWYENMVPAADAINKANPNVLIYLSGLNYDTDATVIPTGSDMGGGYNFRLSDFSYADKLVLELHDYETGATDCNALVSGLKTNGFIALDSNNADVLNVMPVVMTEWGHAQDAASYDSVYQTCLSDFFTANKIGWMVWVISGSYYIRSGTQDYEETWGLLSHDWSGYRDTDGIDSVIKPMVEGTKIS